MAFSYMSTYQSTLAILWIRLGQADLDWNYLLINSLPQYVFHLIYEVEG